MRACLICGGGPVGRDAETCGMSCGATLRERRKALRRLPAKERAVRTVLARLVYDPNGCLIYTGSLNDAGYGRWVLHERPTQRTFLVHRIVYEWAVGPIPEGMQLDHLCRVRPCANPLHLEPVTHVENVRRALPFRPRVPIPTHCGNGHELTEVNLYVPPRVKRWACRACARDRRLAYEARRRVA